MEGHFTTNHDGPMPLTLLGWPDMERGETAAWLSLPGAGSLLLTHRRDGVVAGLDTVPRADWPNVPLVFWAFRVMVGCGFAMLGLAAAGALLRLTRRGPWATPWFLWTVRLSPPLGFVAILAGWITTESGRQPWVVQGLLRTSEAVTPSLTGGDAALGLALFAAAYGVIFPAGLWFMLRLAAAGPGAAPDPAETPNPARASPAETRP
jgi:cytochrome d ubiquinol oxidase subunit I